ncbi:hypothetical protein [Methylogaea oryzae]|uniref:hypothetical protein n=1 Tax=Methylogaea oryzae TaxID=1295382 RepID=UPI0012E2AEDA|nr:hypothetical protein [Methylogaea oryzae]
MDNARKIIGHFGFEDFIDDYLLVDASTADFANLRPIHVAVTETMNRAMMTEPQLAVSANLARYLEADGILVPEQITVSAALLDAGKEFTLLPPDYQAPRLRCNAAVWSWAR